MFFFFFCNLEFNCYNYFIIFRKGLWFEWKNAQLHIKMILGHLVRALWLLSADRAASARAGKSYCNQGKYCCKKKKSVILLWEWGLPWRWNIRLYFKYSIFWLAHLLYAGISVVLQAFAVYLHICIWVCYCSDFARHGLFPISNHQSCVVHSICAPHSLLKGEALNVMENPDICRVIYMLLFVKPYSKFTNP